MTKEQLDRIKKAYSSGLKVQIWFNGYWEDFDIRDYSMYSEPFSENRQYRIIGSDYADIAENRIAELENKIADIKANCDLAIEGRDIKIKELEKENSELKKEVEKHKWNDIFLEDCAGFDKKIAEEYTTSQERIEKLEKENAELKRLRCCENCKNVNLQLHWQESEEIDKRRQFVCGTCGNRKHWEYLGKTVGITETQQLTKAKKVIKELLSCCRNYPQENAEKIKQAEHFLKEIEK